MAVIAAVKRFIPLRLLIAVAVLALLYLLLGYQVLPALGERYLPRYAAEQLQRQASVGEIRVNPLLFKVEIKDFRLAEQDDTPIIGFKRLLVDFELSSLFRWAWTFANITLDGLDLRAEIRPDGSLNLLELLNLLRKPDPDKKDGPPPRMLLQHAVLGNGMFALNDRSGQTPAQAVIGPVNLELHDISTLPELRGPHTLSARLPAGGVFSWRGEASLQPIFSHGEISLKGLKLATLWNFLRDEVNLAEPAGDIDFSLRYQFDHADGASRLNFESMALKVAGLALSEIGSKTPLLTLEAVEATEGRFDLATRELVLPSVLIRKGALAAQADSGGVINWQRLAKPAPAPAAAPAVSAPAAVTEAAAPPPATPWRVKLDAVKIEDVALRYDDHSRVAPLTFSAAALAADFAAELGLGGGPVRATVKDLVVRVSQVMAAEAGVAEPLASLDSIALEGGNFDLAQRSLTARQLRFAGGASRIVRDKSGGLRMVEVFSAADRGKPAHAQSAAAQASEKSQPWRIALDALDAEGLRLSLADHSFGQVVAYDIENLRVGLKNLRNDGKTPVRFEAALRLKQGGAAKVAGEASQDGSRLTARASLERIDLKPLQPIIASRTKLSLASGEVSANMKVDYRARAAAPELRVAGPASMDNLLLNEAGSTERLLAWKSLTASGLSFSLAPDRLTVDEVLIAGLGAKVVISKDRSFNLATAFAPPGPAATDAKTQEPVAKPAPAAGADQKAREPAAQPAQTAAADAEPAFPIVVDRVRIEKGVVDFADLSLVLPFGAKVHELDGMISGISTARASRTAVQLEGRVDEYGLARVQGTLSPFNPKAFTDISVIFRNVDMPPLTAYSATFAGRRIASGKLALDLRYKIENSELAGDNRLVLEKFTLGERVESPNALNLPLDLAIAVLTDSDGKIDLAMPVRGNVDNPEFSYGHLVWQAIVNVITRIVTAPFRALGALFGGGSGENFDNVAFDPGRAILLPPEQEKLKQVAAALGKRPQLKLAVQGSHGSKDRQALQQRNLQLAVADKLGRKPGPGQEPGLVNVADAKTQRALEQIFAERNSDSALTAYAAEVEKSRGKPVDRVNPVLALVGRASADAAFYTALLRRLEQSAAVADDALKQLADARAKSVIDNLAGMHAVPAARLEQRPAVAAEGDTPPQAKLILDVARGG